MNDTACWYAILNKKACNSQHSRFWLSLADHKLHAYTNCGSVTYECVCACCYFLKKIGSMESIMYFADSNQQVNYSEKPAAWAAAALSRLSIMFPPSLLLCILLHISLLPLHHISTLPSHPSPILYFLWLKITVISQATIGNAGMQVSD